MKRLLAIVPGLFLTLLVAPTASAGGFSLQWNDCGDIGSGCTVFACDTNAGIHIMVGSFVSPVALDAVEGLEAVIALYGDLPPDGPGPWTPPPLPDWWRLRNQSGQTGQCRAGAMFSDASFIAGPYNCADLFEGTAVGGVSGYTVDPNGARVQLSVAFAVPSSEARSVAAETEYYGFRVVITNAKTVGTGACSGCALPMFAFLGEVRLLQPSSADLPVLRLTQPIRQLYAAWQAGNGPCDVTLTRRETWGGVKSLYR